MDETRRTLASDGSQSFFFFGMLELCVAVNRFVNIFRKSTRDAVQRFRSNFVPELGVSVLLENDNVTI